MGHLNWDSVTEPILSTRRRCEIYRSCVDLERQIKITMALKAVKVIAPGEAGVVSDATVPRVRDDYLIAKTKAVALNPTDYHHAKHFSVPGTVLGCDWAGIVQEVGKNVTRFKPGDEVSGVCHGGELGFHHQPFELKGVCEDRTRLI